MTNLKRMVRVTAFLLVVFLMASKAYSPGFRRDEISFLSAGARKNIISFKNAMDWIHGEREALCPMDPALRAKLKPKLDAIHFDLALTPEGKERAARKVFAAFDPQIRIERARMENCIRENLAEWESLDEKEFPLQEACTPKPPVNEDPARLMHRRGPPPPPPPIASLPASVRAELEARLSSAPCQEAIAAFHGG